MVLRFHKPEYITTIDGEQFEVTPATVEDMEEILELQNLREEITEMTENLEKDPEKAEKEGMSLFKNKEFLPIFKKLSQRCIKRDDPENRNLSNKELDLIPDTIIPIIYEIEIANKMIRLAFTRENTGEGDDKGKEKKQGKKSKK